MNLENSAPCKFDIYKIEEVEHGDKEACDESWGCLGSSSKSVDWSDNARSDPYGGFESDSMSMIPASESKSCKLPAGWEERIAANTKESYFYDTISRKVYFTLPPSDHREAERDAWNGSPRCTLRCRHILVKHNESDRCSSYREPVVNRTKREALHKILQTRDLVGSGESEFAALARTISDCCSARHGGDLGPLRLTQTSFGFEENILLLNTPELSEIFQTNAGYHILWRTPVHNRKRNKRGSLEQLINSTKKEPKTHLKKNKYFSMRKPKAFLCNSIGEKQGTRAFDSKSSCPSGFSFKTPCPTLESLAPDDSIIYAKQQCELPDLPTETRTADAYPHHLVPLRKSRTYHFYPTKVEVRMVVPQKKGTASTQLKAQHNKQPERYEYLRSSNAIDSFHSEIHVHKPSAYCIKNGSFLFHNICIY